MERIRCSAGRHVSASVDRYDGVTQSTLPANLPRGGQGELRARHQVGQLGSTQTTGRAHSAGDCRLRVLPAAHHPATRHKATTATPLAARHPATAHSPHRWTLSGSWQAAHHPAVRHPDVCPLPPLDEAQQRVAQPHRVEHVQRLLVRSLARTRPRENKENCRPENGRHWCFTDGVVDRVAWALHPTVLASECIRAAC